jgi:hypothetical protein
MRGRKSDRCVDEVPSPNSAYDRLREIDTGFASLGRSGEGKEEKKKLFLFETEIRVTFLFCSQL